MSTAGNRRPSGGEDVNPPLQPEDGEAMSAHRYTDCRIDCDRPGCPRSEFASHLDLIDATAANARKFLAGRGWKVGISDGHGTRMDFCPEHAPEATQIAPEDRKA